MAVFPLIVFVLFVDFCEFSWISTIEIQVRFKWKIENKGFADLTSSLFSLSYSDSKLENTLKLIYNNFCLRKSPQNINTGLKWKRKFILCPDVNVYFTTQLNSPVLVWFKSISRLQSRFLSVTETREMPPSPFLNKSVYSFKRVIQERVFNCLHMNNGFPLR